VRDEMAHFAQLDENNLVTQVIVVANEELLLDGVENETKGIEFCKSLLGENTRWVQTSYNGNIRKNYAGIGYTYDPVADHFFAPQPYPSWTLDADAKWQSPILYPVEEGKFFTWDEPTLSWVEIVPPTE
jgi:hypothetical protein